MVQSFEAKGIRTCHEYPTVIITYCNPIYLKVKIVNDSLHNYALSFLPHVERGDWWGSWYWQFFHLEFYMPNGFLWCAFTTM